MNIKSTSTPVLLAIKAADMMNNSLIGAGIGAGAGALGGSLYNRFGRKKDNKSGWSDTLVGAGLGAAGGAGIGAGMSAFGSSSTPTAPASSISSTTPPTSDTTVKPSATARTGRGDLGDVLKFTGEPDDDWAKLTKIPAFQSWRHLGGAAYGASPFGYLFSGKSLNDRVNDFDSHLGNMQQRGLTPWQSLWAINQPPAIRVGRK